MLGRSMVPFACWWGVTHQCRCFLVVGGVVEPLDECEARGDSTVFVRALKWSWARRVGGGDG